MSPSNAPNKDAPHMPTHPHNKQPNISQQTLPPTSLMDLLTQDDDRPYANYPGDPHTQRTQSSQHLSQRTWMALSQDQHITAIVDPQPALWDTDMTGLACGTLDHFLATPTTPHHALVSLLHTATQHLHSQGIQHITTRIQGHNHKAHALRDAGFQVVDGLLHLGCQPTATTPPTHHPPCTIHTAQQEDLDVLLQDVAPAFYISRFHTDPLIPTSRADALHREWLRNTIQGDRADIAFVATQHHRPVGLASLRFDHATTAFLPAPGAATVDLVAVSPQAQKQGIGRALITHCIQWATHHHIPFLHIATQIWNTPALRLYTACGFAHLHARLTFRAFRGSV